MRLARIKREPAAENVLPLINIVFLLLIFFMLAGALQKVDPIEITPPETNGGEAVSARPAVILLSKSGTIAFQERILERATLLKDLSKRIEANPDLKVLFKADAKADASMVIGLIDELRAIGVANLSLLTTGTS